MTGTVVASLAAIALFLLLLTGTRAVLRLPALSPRARAALAGLTGLAFPWVVYLAVRLLDDAKALDPLEAFFETHRRTGLLVTVPATVLGFSLFMGGILHLLFTSGPSESFTVAELARALRTGAWLRSRRWRRRVVIVTGVALFTFGLFGLGVVLAPAGGKLLLIAALLYAVGNTLRCLPRLSRRHLDP